MKLTKAELERIIKEELGQFAEGEEGQSKEIEKIGSKVEMLQTTFKKVPDEKFEELISLVLKSVIVPIGKVTKKTARDVFKLAAKTISDEQDQAKAER